MFFQAVALRQRYLDDLAAAAAESRITAAQHQWLELLVESIRVARNGKVRPQVGRLSTADGFWETTGACTGVLLGSEQPGDWTMFWYSPFTGLRQFASRKRLVEALSGWLDLPASEPPQWSVEWFAGDPFEQLETMLIGGHAECLGRLADQLLQLPSLPDLLGAPEAERFAEAVVKPGEPLLARGQTRLDEFWRHAAPGQPTRRQLAAQALADGWGFALLAARQRGELPELEFNDLRTLLPGSAGLASGLMAGTLSLAINGQSAPLAGVLVVNLASAVLVFSAWGGLRRFATLDEHAQYFNQSANRQALLAGVALGQQALVLGAHRVQLQTQRLARGHFLRLADGCIAWQSSNLKQGLNKLEAPLSKACSAIDDAQDVRHLLNCSLVTMGNRGRWRERSEVAGRAPAVPSAQAVGALAGEEPAGTLTWGDYQARALQQVDVLAALQPTAGDCAREVLNRHLALFDGPRGDSAQLWVRLDDSHTLSLTSLFLQRLSGYGAASLVDGAQVLEGADTLPAQQRTVSAFNLRLLDIVLGHAAKAFNAAFDAQVRRGRTQLLRAHGLQVQPARLAQRLLAGLLRQALTLEQRLARLKPANLGMLEQALQHPALPDRSGFGQQAVEAYSLAVQYDVRQPPVVLNGACVLQRSTSNLSTLLLWSPVSGLQEFDSDAKLQAVIRLGLSDLASRAAWLGQVSEPARSQLAFALDQPDAASLVVQLVAIEDSFISHLQAGEAQLQCRALVDAMQSARARRCTAEQIENALAATQAQDGFRNGIEAVAQAIELERFSSVIPGWVSAASVAGLDQLADLLQRYYATHRPELSFLAGIPGLQAHAREKLLAALGRDFPGANLNPDLIPLSWVQYTAAPVALGEVPSGLPAATKKVTGSLTDYAVNRLYSPPDATLTVDIAGGFLGDSGLNVAYLERLVSQLDVAASYRLLLELAFGSHDVEYPRRLQRFALQFTARLRLAACELGLRKMLSTKAMAFMERILEMPDGLARQPLEGRQVVVCPLQLLAGEGRAGDVVSGMYLVGNRSGASGPWVLLVLLADSLELREYDDLPAIVDDLQNDSALSGLVLQRLAPQARHVYAHGGFKEPHLPWSAEDSFAVPWAAPAPPAILVQPMLGNACKQFFEATLALLLAQAREQSVTSAEHDSHAWRFLVSLGAEQLLAFLPGKLGLVIAAWQARALAGEVLSAVRQHRWGEAFAQFCATLAMFVSTRHEAIASHPHGVPQAALEVRLEDPLQNRLRQFEVHDISLSELETEPLFNLYRDPQRNHRYAVVAGKLYRVRAEGGAWRIVWHEVNGPAVRLNHARQWEMSVGLKGGGPVASRLQGAGIEMSVQSIFTVEARGMPEIRRLYRDRARRIGQAHAWGLNYVRTALENLKPEASTGLLPAPTSAVLCEFFGVRTVEPQLLERVRASLGTLLDTFLEPSLSPWSSERFVVGMGKGEYEENPAFTYSHDPQRRIFLGSRFFEALKVRLKPPPSGHNGFDMGAHFRAAVLLHELSHIGHGSLDIAYIDAVLPYLDMIEGTGSYYGAVKSGVEKCQKRTLSHLASRDELFSSPLGDGPRRDLDKTDNGALEAVLRLAGTKTLDQARDVFMQDARRRAEIILANADSVALLTTLLGRRRFTTPLI
jgi:hypothetical protein